MDAAQIEHRRARFARSPEWALERIQLSTRDGLLDIDAEVYGPFAIHVWVARDGLKRDRTVLSHVPTGRFLAEFRCVEHAKDAVPHLVVLYDWWGSMPSTKEAAQELGEQTIGTITAAGGWR